MRKRFRLAAVALVLALLAQPLGVAAACALAPAKECPSPEAQDMHCPPASQLQALERSACCRVQSAPATPPKDPAATIELSAAVIPVKASGLSAAPVLPLRVWTYHDPPKLQDSSQTQALLCVFLI